MIPQIHTATIVNDRLIPHPNCTRIRSGIAAVVA